MKIAIVCSAGIVSGKEIISLELCEGLRYASQDVTVVTSSWGSDDFAVRLRAMNMNFCKMRLGFISATMRPAQLRMTAHQIVHWPKMLFDWLRFLKREKPTTIIHTNWHHLLLLWPFLSVDRDIYWVHDTFAPSERYARFLTALSHRIGCFIAVSEAAADGLRRNGVKDAMIRVIRNGIADPSVGAAPVARVEGEVGIGIVGSIAEWKGHEDLIEAFSKLAAVHSRVCLHVFGFDDTEYAERLKSWINARGLARRVVWHGFVGDRAKIYPLIDICVVPSRVDDSLPTTAIEAAFFELPVVASHRGGLPEIVSDGESGFIVESENPDELAGRLEELISNSTLRATMGAAARLRAVGCFGRERFIIDFLRLLGAAPVGPSPSPV